MNYADVAATLASVIDPQSEGFRRATEKYRDRTPDFAATLVAHEIGAPLVKVLARQPEYSARPNLMMRMLNGSLSAAPAQIVPRLIQRAQRTNCNDAVRWLDK